MDDDDRCACWFGDAVLHGGHCCFRDDDGIGPVYCHRISAEWFPDAPARDEPSRWPQAEPKSIDDGALLPAPDPEPRLLCPVPAQDAAREIVTRWPAAVFL